MTEPILSIPVKATVEINDNDAVQTISEIQQQLAPMKETCDFEIAVTKAMVTKTIRNNVLNKNINYYKDSDFDGSQAEEALIEFERIFKRRADVAPPLEEEIEEDDE